MIYINDLACNGCGACVDSCSTGALIFQNTRAIIDQDLCRECEVCLDACPQCAIISGERQPVTPAVIQMPEFPSQVERTHQVGLRDMVLPAISSLLLWTGRELVPRLADAALGYLDRKTQSSSSLAPQELGLRGGGRASNPGTWNGSGRRRQRHRKNQRF